MSLGERFFMIYFFRENKLNGFNAGAKAPSDIEIILEQLGYIPISFPHRMNKSSVFTKIYLAVMSLIAWIKFYMKVRENDIIIYQHPIMASMPLANYMIKKIRSKKKINMIAIVHDLSSYRFSVNECSKSRMKFYKKSDAILTQFDYVICHNNKMKEYLSQYINSTQIIELGIFDYLTNHLKKNNTFYNNNLVITIAGNLSNLKCGYIYKMKNLNIKLYLYGNNYKSEKNNDNVIYKGSFDPSELVEKIEGSFGLVWDGNEVETCAGNYGNYMKINNPHKLSLYLASNMPVIVWKDAAIADFVKKNNLGIAINSLLEIPEKLRKLTNDEYLEMKNNAGKIGKQIRNGYYTRNAINKCMDLISIKNKIGEIDINE